MDKEARFLEEFKSADLDLSGIVLCVRDLLSVRSCLVVLQRIVGQSNHPESAKAAEGTLTAVPQFFLTLIVSH